MENAKAKEVKNATVTKRSDGEDWSGAREERCGEANYSKRPCLSEQSKTISFTGPAPRYKEWSGCTVVTQTSPARGYGGAL